MGGCRWAGRRGAGERGRRAGLMLDFPGSMGPLRLDADRWHIQRRRRRPPTADRRRRRREGPTLCLGGGQSTSGSLASGGLALPSRWTNSVTPLEDAQSRHGAHGVPDQRQACADAPAQRQPRHQHPTTGPPRVPPPGRAVFSRRPPSMSLRDEIHEQPAAAARFLAAQAEPVERIAALVARPPAAARRHRRARDLGPCRDLRAVRPRRPASAVGRARDPVDRVALWRRARSIRRAGHRDQPVGRLAGHRRRHRRRPAPRAPRPSPSRTTPPRPWPRPPAR